MSESASRQALNTATKLADITSQAGGAQLWTARVDQVDEAQWIELDSLLDAAERAQALRFRVDADRRAYVLAHALRRAALSLALDADPSSIELSSDAKGRPLLLAPHTDQPLYFSHSRCRIAVAVAIASSPVGVDVEANDPSAVDREILPPFVADSGAQEFFACWTTLEAFWKAVGTGLASSNPRIYCRANLNGKVSISLETQPERPLAQAAVVTSQPGCTISIALCHPGLDPGSMAEVHHGRRLRIESAMTT
jgi:phosphopantetheinyl transferase